MMNPLQVTIWQNILAFDLDQPVAEYSFSTRLAYENGWSLEFTKRAIIEYKKFMLLARTSEQMVSPSPIVDIVWHQHLIFSTSYKAFCDTLGKQIEHIPSLHNHAEKAKFASAFQHTHQEYIACWGEPPADIWQARQFGQTLTEQPKSALPMWALMLIMTLLPAFSYQFVAPLLKPVVQEIDNPFFLIGYWALFFIMALYLFFSRNQALQDYAQRLHEEGILQNIAALELIYMKKKRLADVVHCVVNELIKNNYIEVQSNHALKAIKSSKTARNSYDFAVLQTLENLGGEAHYPPLLGELVKKQVFTQTKNFVDTLEKKTTETAAYTQIIGFGSLLFTVFLLFGFVRMDLGLMREKPIVFLLVSLISMTLIALMVLHQTTKQLFRTVIPQLFQQNLAYRTQQESYEEGDDFDWQYLMLGNSVITSSFSPIITHIESHNETDGGSSSCGSSDSGGDSGGSSCGSGCGGCGGGGD